jgi:hypothetical protein
VSIKGDVAYLDDVGVVKGGALDLNLGTTDSLVTEEGRHRFLGGVLIFLDTLLTLGFWCYHRLAYTKNLSASLQNNQEAFSAPIERLAGP